LIKPPGHLQESTVRDTAARFLQSIKNRDSRSFWDTLDKKGQGYFLGMWFYALESMNVQTLVQLTGEPNFLEGVLGPIIKGLRDSMGDLLEAPFFGDIQYSTPRSATVRVCTGDNPQAGDSIPLVLEISETPDQSTDCSLTVWKIDTLNCFQLNRGAH